MSLNVSRETKPPLYVVEGKNDKLLLQSITSAPILITNGLGYSETFVNELVQLELKYNIHLVLDPDGPGEKIRRTLRNALSNPVDVYIPLKDARDNKKNKVGVEHVSRETLENVIQQGSELNHQSMITSSQLLALGLHGTVGSKALRQRLCDKLNIGTANAKTLRFKLMIYGYNFDMIHELVKVI